MAKVEFWNNNNYGGLSDTFQGTQRRTYGSSPAWDSIKTDANTWVVIWDGQNCTGNYMKIGGSSSASNSDLNKTQRGSDKHDDWKNAIMSFMMFSSQPSWWNSSSKPPVDFSYLGSTQALACSSTKFYDDTNVFSGASNHDDLSETKWPTNSGSTMSDAIQSLATGSSVWMEVWNDVNYQGDWMKLSPNTHYSDLEQYTRPSSLGDWKNQIKSLKIFTSKPDCWDMSFDLQGFYLLFPDYTPYDDSSGTYVTYTTQDCGYDVRRINESYDQTTYTVSFRVDYCITAGTNDKVWLNITVNADGSLNGVTYSYKQGDGAVQIPDTFVKAVDKTAELLGALGALETVGISEEAAEDFIVAFDTFCKVFNDVTKLLYKKSLVNDGRSYMLAVCLHALCRGFASIKAK
jgi:hypothetical protein